MKTTVVSTSTAANAKVFPLEEVKDHLRLERGYMEEDDHLNSLYEVARDYVQEITNRKLVTQTIDYKLDQWPKDEHIALPYGNLQTVTHVKYVDVDNSTATLSSTAYSLDTVSYKGRVVLGYGDDWPTATLHPNNPITVRFTCGYGLSSQVPSPIKQAMKLLISDLYENREPVILGQGLDMVETKVVRRLLAPYRIWEEQ